MKFELCLLLRVFCFVFETRIQPDLGDKINTGKWKLFVWYFCFSCPYWRNCLLYLVLTCILCLLLIMYHCSNSSSWLYIYIYIYIYICGEFNKFPGIQNCRRLLKIQYLIAIHLMRWLTNFYDFRFKSTATAAIGIHPTKTWLSQLVNFKNAIWHFRSTICNKILF